MANVYDENEAIKFIKNYLPIDIRDKKYSDDDILLLIDAIFDYFEANDEDDDFELDIDELVKYTQKQLKKDPDNKIELDDVKALVEGELEYENSLED